MLTADPWLFLTATINQRLAEKPRGTKRKRTERALYFANLAESFFHSVKQSALPISGTLAYYGVLNLVKCFLSMNGIDLETKLEHHGLSLPLGQEQKIHVSKPNPNVLNIFHEFARLLGKPVKRKETHSLKNLSSHLPDIYEMAYTLGHVAGPKRGFLPIDVRLLFTDNEGYMFSEIAYEKKQLNRVDTGKFLTGKRKDYFESSYEKESCLVHRSARRKPFDGENLKRIYSNLCKEYADFDISSLLTSRGYVYYCDLQEPKYHHLSYSLLMMFYIGTAARYRPSEMSELLSSDMRPLISEAIAVIPGQMLYHLVSLCTQRNCVVPHATVAS